MGNVQSEGQATTDGEDEAVFFDASHGGLTEVPSDAFNIGTMQLAKIMLQANQLRAVPERVFSVETVRSLNLSDNELVELPEEIGNLLALEELILCKNAIERIPDTIGQLKVLKLLDVNSCPLDAVPDALCECESLMQLTLSDIYLDSLPNNIGKLSRLEVLELRENMLDRLPSSFYNLARLRRLDLGSNRFEEIPYGFSRLFSLQELYMDQNKLTELPESFCQLDSLQILDLSNNTISNIPNEFNQLRNLTDLELSNNRIDALPDISSLTRLVSVRVNQNQLTFLPESLGSCTAIRELYASSNHISSLPGTVGSLGRLSTLCMDENELTQLPNQIGMCHQLSLLSLRNNQLRLLPESIENLFELTVLNIVNNRIQYLPSGLAELPKLTALWMSDNQARPLIPLQTDFALDGISVLTCYMLPQNQRNETVTIEDEGIEDGEIGDEDTLGDMMMSGDGGLAAMHKEPGHARRSMISFGHDVSSEVKPPSLMPREARTRLGRPEAEMLKRTSSIGNALQFKYDPDPIYDNLPNLPKKSRHRRSFVDEFDENEEDRLREMIAQSTKKKGKKEKKSKKNKDKDKVNKDNSKTDLGSEVSPGATLSSSNANTPQQARTAAGQSVTSSDGKVSTSSDQVATSPFQSTPERRQSERSDALSPALATLALDGEPRRTPTPSGLQRQQDSNSQLQQQQQQQSHPVFITDPDHNARRPFVLPKPASAAESIPALPPKSSTGSGSNGSSRLTGPTADALPAVTPTTSFSSTSSSPANPSSLDWRANAATAAATATSVASAPQAGRGASSLNVVTNSGRRPSTTSEGSVSPEPPPPPRSSSYNRVQMLKSPEQTQRPDERKHTTVGPTVSFSHNHTSRTSPVTRTRANTVDSVGHQAHAHGVESNSHHGQESVGDDRRGEQFNDARSMLANMMKSSAGPGHSALQRSGSGEAVPASNTSIGYSSASVSTSTTLSTSSSAPHPAASQQIHGAQVPTSASVSAKPPVAKKPAVSPKTFRSPQKPAPPPPSALNSGVTSTDSVSSASGSQYQPSSRPVTTVTAPASRYSPHGQHSPPSDQQYSPQKTISPVSPHRLPVSRSFEQDMRGPANRPMSAEPSLHHAGYTRPPVAPKPPSHSHQPSAVTGMSNFRLPSTEHLTEPGQRHSISTVQGDARRMLGQHGALPGSVAPPAAPMFVAKSGGNHPRPRAPSAEPTFDRSYHNSSSSATSSAPTNGYMPGSTRASVRSTAGSKPSSGSSGFLQHSSLSSNGGSHSSTSVFGSVSDSPGQRIDAANLTPTVMYVVLRKRTTLGFKVTGGHGSGGNPYLPKDPGVFVSEVLDRSTCVSGEVKEGDKLLALDNIPLENLTHRDAVNVLRQAAGLIRVKLLRYVPSDEAGTLF
ncbi:erbin-like [Sycon ciliatum]|uniref:erbin-like n=1 Tax=Sycon ciliatum TaxID=27933 RepID=UPI0031F6A247